MKDKISVIIPTKNRIEEVKTCLESILAQTLVPDEIIIVDGSDTEELGSEIKQFNDKIKIIYVHTTKPGLTRQRNIGIKASHSDFIIFFDDDMILDKDCVKEMLRVFSKDTEKKIGGVTANVITEQEVKMEQQVNFAKRLRRFVNHAVSIISLGYRYGNGKFRPSGFPTIIRNGSVDKITNVEFLYGGSMAFRKEIFNEFKFDENLQGYCYGEDDEFAYRISRKYQNVFNPHAIVVHKPSQAERADICTRKKMEVENFYYFYRKNLPQTFKHKFAFYWYIVGSVIRSTILIIVKRDSSEIKGVVSGVISIIRGKAYPRG